VARPERSSGRASEASKKLLDRLRRSCNAVAPERLLLPSAPGPTALLWAGPPRENDVHTRATLVPVLSRCLTCTMMLMRDLRSPTISSDPSRVAY